MGISQSLPRTGIIKMVDIWMIFTMSYPFLVIAFHCTLEVKLTLALQCDLSEVIFKFSRLFAPEPEINMYSKAEIMVSEG